MRRGSHSGWPCSLVWRVVRLVRRERRGSLRGPAHDGITYFVAPVPAGHFGAVAPVGGFGVAVAATIKYPTNFVPRASRSGGGRAWQVGYGGIRVLEKG